ncbi:MAG TPA: hypothetical protein VF174_15665 [Micromonosporaceae bacterium]
MRPINVAFEGDPPRVGPGNRVECLTASGEWITMRAHSEPRYVPAPTAPAFGLTSDKRWVDDKTPTGAGMRWRMGEVDA